MIKILLNRFPKICTILGMAMFAMAISVQSTLADAEIKIPDPIVSSSPSSVADLASKVIALLGWVVGVSSGVGLLVGALLYIISAGDPGKTRTAKDAIVYSIVGLAVALLSYGIVTFVLSKKG